MADLAIFPQTCDYCQILKDSPIPRPEKLIYGLYLVAFPTLEDHCYRIDGARALQLMYLMDRLALRCGAAWA